jgi:hydroxymethylpyrimidine/phosphomethylpyrimidine kinase
VKPPRILIIAGSDSGGGAGIQADIKTVTMLGGYAMTAITAVTAQNSLGVREIFALPSEYLMHQIAAVKADLGIDAVKVGMLANESLAWEVEDHLRWTFPGIPIVLDPVMVATSGDALNEAGTAVALSGMLGQATIVTPNVPELAALAQMEVVDEETMLEAALFLSRSNDCAILAKGGHLPGREVVDLLVAGDRLVGRWAAPRIETTSTHGTGCTLASAVATGLGAGMALEAAIERARLFVRAAMLAAPGFGAGNGPLGHALGVVPFDLIHNKDK